MDLSLWHIRRNDGVRGSRCGSHQSRCGRGRGGGIGIRDGCFGFSSLGRIYGMDAGDYVLMFVPRPLSAPKTVRFSCADGVEVLGVEGTTGRDAETSLDG
jgi:hypothetical protein